VTASKTPDPKIRFKLTSLSFSLILTTVCFGTENMQRGPGKVSEQVLNQAQSLFKSAV